MEYVFKDREHKTLLTACYLLEHPHKKEVTDKELSDWCIRVWIELKESEVE